MLYKQDMLKLKKENKQMKAALKTFNFPFLKVFHVSHQLSNPIHSYRNYDKNKTNGHTILIFKTAEDFTAIYTTCDLRDNYNKVLGTNIVLRNMASLIHKQHVRCINFKFNDTYVQFNERELVRQALYHIKKLSNSYNIPSYEDLPNDKLKSTIKSITESIETEDNKVVFKYEPLLVVDKFAISHSIKLKNVGTKSITALLINRSTEEVIEKVTVNKHPKQKDNRLVGRAYALEALRKKINKNQ